MLVALALLFASFPEPVRKVMDLALASPPEIAADALIRLSPYAGSRDGSIELLERASGLSRSAVHAYLVGGGLFYVDPESREGRLSSALEPGFARHSLEVRAARALFRLDARRGAQALFRMQPPQFPALTCTDAVKWRTGEYYDFVREVFEGGFTTREKGEGKHVAMLEDQLRALTSPFQLYPLTHLLAQVSATDAQFHRLVAVYATALKTLAVDDRSFTSGTRHDFTQAIYDLMGRCRKSGLSPVPVLDAYRTYMERGLTGRRCEDSAEHEGEGAVLENVAKLLNAELRKADLTAMDFSDRKPHILRQHAQVHRFWSSPASRRLYERLKVLQRETDKSGERWERMLREFLGDMAEWTRDHTETPVDHFHQRALIYINILRAMSAGSLRDGVTSEYVRFLAGSSIQRDSPPEWYMYAWDLHNVVGTDEVRRSGHPGLLLPIELRALASRTAARTGPHAELRH